MVKRHAFICIGGPQRTIAADIQVGARIADILTLGSESRMRSPEYHSAVRAGGALLASERMLRTATVEWEKR
jgi:hypothetical protein